MAEFLQQNQIISDRPEQKKRKPLFAVLTAVLIVVLVFLFLCIFPGGHKVLGIVLPVPKGVPIVTSLNPIAFQNISPPVGGGTSLIVFPVGGTPVGVPPLPPTFPPPATDLTANGSDDPIEISNGSSALLKWITANDPTSCLGSGAWSGSKNPAGGAEETGPLFGPDRYKYKITCSNDYGSASDVSTVIVSGPPGGGGGGGSACVVCPAPQTIGSALSFSNNNLVSGVFPEYNFTAPPEGGSVNISASISPPLGGACLNLPGPFRVFLYDNNVVKFGGPGEEIYGTFSGWSGNFPEFFADSGSAHAIKLVVQTNCAGGIIQSIVNFTEASMTAVGPSPAVCPLSMSLLPIKFSSNELVSGLLPEYQFTAFDNELVKVSASVAGYTGGPCLAPPYRVSLYDNDILKFGPINASGGSWSGDFPDFAVSPGQHKIKLGIATNCGGSQNAPIQSLVSFPGVSMDVEVLNVPADAPQICEQTISSSLYDFGDAPDADNGDFPSLLASKGARHKEQPFLLGEKADKEFDSHQVDQDSPDSAIGADDGWDWQSLTVTNVAWPSDNPIYLNVLYDLNNNLKWDSNSFSLEHLVIDEELLIPEGESIEYTLPLQVSALIPAGFSESWIRFTLTDIKLGQNYNGSWPMPFEYGETEDYSRPLFFPPIKYPPKPPRGDGGPPPGGPGSGSGDGSAGSGEGGPSAGGVTVIPVISGPVTFTLKLPQKGFQSARALPFWFDNLLKFITASTDLTQKESEVSVNIFRSLGVRPEQLLKEVRVVERVEKLVPIFIQTQPQKVVKPIPSDGVISTAPQQVSVQIVSQNTFKDTFTVLFKNLTPKEGLAVVQYFDRTGTLMSTNKIPVDPFSSFKTEYVFLPNSAFAKLQMVSDGTESIIVTAYSAAVLIGGTPGGPVTTGGGGGCGTITVTESPSGPHNVTGPLPVTVATITTVSASGGTTPYTYSITSGSLPSSLTLNSSSGVIGGTADTVTNNTFTVQASDNSSCTGTVSITINVSAF